ncbi:Unknown protein [Striga hermonthica]|uniref:Uncharacterized protein n=1 Tax=Striga hermonthica TaxID=68872 RepID=A0A9N7MZQ0_STRHE|nr:Unknown protein [Striga hermonthica]
MADDHHGVSGATTNALLALLQERFRQLEKMKELRQEKELLRMLSESSRKYVNVNVASSSSSPPTCDCCDHHPEIVHSEKRLRSEVFCSPPRPNCQLSLSLWPDSSTDSRGAIAGPPSKSRRSTDGPFVCTSQVKMENSGYDVDTSLRL